jgi:hypothetical protein
MANISTADYAIQGLACRGVPCVSELVGTKNSHTQYSAPH